MERRLAASIGAVPRREDGRGVLGLGQLSAVVDPIEPKPGRDGEWICLIDGTITHPPGIASAGPGPEVESLLARRLREHGEAAIAELDGEFALLAWSERGQRGLIARDRRGSRPLLIAETEREAWIGSELSDLARAGHSPPGPDPAAMAVWLDRSLPADHRTLLSDVTRLPAGCVATLTSDGVGAPRKLERPPLHRAGSDDRAAAVGRLREAMGAAVERSLRRVERPGVMLSGGFDSAAVAALARALGADPAAYSGVFPEHPDADESERIATLRATLGLRGRVESPGRESALGWAERFIDRWGLPPATANLFVWGPLIELARSDGVEVLLDGEGGDELFGLSTALIADRLRSGRVRAATRLARRVPGMGSDPRRRWVRSVLREYGLRAAIPAGLHRRLRDVRQTPATPKPWLTPRARDLAHEHSDPDHAKRGSGPLWARGLRFALLDGPDLFGVADEHRRQSGLLGVRFAHPWRDPRLIDLALSTAPELNFDPDLDRPLAREAVRDLLPASIVESTEKPFFNSVLSETLRTVDADQLRMLLVDDPPAALDGLIDPGGAKSLLDDPSQRAAWPLDVWRAGSLALWLRSLRH